MKLPMYTAQAPVPSKTGLGEYHALPATFGQAIPRALAQVGQQVQQTAVSVGEELAVADRRRRQLEEANLAATLTTEGELLLKQRSFDIQQGQDYNLYDAQMTASAKEITTQILAKTKNPNVRAAVTNRLTQKAGEERLDLQTAKMKKYTDVQVAAMDQNLLNIENLIALSSKPEEIANYTGLALGNIDAMVQAGQIPHVEGVKRKSKFLEGISAVKARQDLERDPEAFIANVDRYINLDPTKRQSLVEHARKEVEFRANKADRELRQREADERRALKEWQSENSKQLMLQIKQGQAGMGTVMEMAAAGQLDENDTRFYLNYFDTKARQAESAARSRDAALDRAQRQREHDEDRHDRTTFGSIKTDIYGGTKTPDEAMELAKSGKLNPRVSGAIAEFAAQQKAQGQQTVSAETAELRRQFNRMEEETKGEFLGYVPPSGSDKGKQYQEELEILWSEFQSHARARSKAWSTSPDALADPWEVKRQIVDEYRDRARGIIRRSGQYTLRLIPERYRPSTDANGDADFGSIQLMKRKLRDEVDAKRLTPSEARIQAERLRELERGRAAQDREHATLPAEPTAPAAKPAARKPAP